MQLLDLYVLVLRIVGIWVAFSGLVYLTAFVSAASVGFLIQWAFALVVYGAAAFVLLRYPSAVAKWLVRDEGGKDLTLGLSARDLQSVLVSTIGFYLVVMGIPALVASLIPQAQYRSGIVWQGVVRPAVQLIIGALILTRQRWGPRREGGGN
ncbi:MAG: hypothetical protein PHF77_05760 [Candidatus Bipolaricaulis anaerobius]|nr:hypothetical protein [Candidatus Bipolaricaulis anaerobius]